MFPKAKRFVNPANSTPAPGSYNVANEKKKAEAVKFARSKRFADLKDSLPGPTDTSAYLDLSSCSASSWNGTSSFSTPREKKTEKVKFEKSKLEMTIVLLEKEIKDLKGQNSKAIASAVEKEDKSVATESGAWTQETTVVETTSQGVSTERNTEEKSVGTDVDPAIADVSALLEAKEKELSNLQLQLRCDQETSRADLELEQSRNAALKMRLEALENTNKDLEMDRDQAEEENRKLHGVAAELRAETLDLEQRVDEKEKETEELQSKLNSVIEDGQKKISTLEAAVFEEVQKVRSQEDQLKNALETCEVNFSEAQSTAEKLATKNSELKTKVDEMEENLVEVILREQKAMENLRCLEAEKCSLECQLTQSHNDYEQRLELAGSQVEQLQTEIKRNEEMMTNNLRSLTVKYEALEQSYANEKSNYEQEHQTLTANLEASKKSLEDNETQIADLEFVCVNLKEQMIEEQQVTSEIKDVCQELIEKLEASESKVKQLEEDSLEIQEAAETDRNILEAKQTEFEKKIAEHETREAELSANLENALSVQNHHEEELIRARDESDRSQKEVVMLKERLKDVEDSLTSKATQAEEKGVKIKEEFGRRLVETQKKLTQTEINFSRYKEEQTMIIKKMEDELSRRKRVHEEQIEQIETDYKRRILDVEQENAVLEEKLNRSGSDAMLAELKAQVQMWQTKYEDLEQKIEPFKEQLDAYELEKNALLSRNSEAEHEVAKLGAQYAKLLGHQNNKQKIHHVLKLKQENISLKSENARLRDQSEKQKRTIKRLEEKPDNVTSRKKFNPSEAFTHAKKENRPLSVIDGNVTTKK